VAAERSDRAAGRGGWLGEGMHGVLADAEVTERFEAAMGAAVREAGPTLLVEGPPHLAPVDVASLPVVIFSTPVRPPPLAGWQKHPPSPSGEKRELMPTGGERRTGGATASQLHGQLDGGQRRRGDGRQDQLRDLHATVPARRAAQGASVWRRALLPPRVHRALADRCAASPP
jgi:hypothetical protein